MEFSISFADSGYSLKTRNLQMFLKNEHGLRPLSAGLVREDIYLSLSQSLMKKAQKWGSVRTLPQ